MTQRLQARRERVSLELAKREEPYGQFIEEATPLFADSIEKTDFDPGKIFDLYSILGRIRLSSSDEVLHEAERGDCEPAEVVQQPPVREVRV